MAIKHSEDLTNAATSCTDHLTNSCFLVSSCISLPLSPLLSLYTIQEPPVAGVNNKQEKNSD
ncbi:hypothetical protein GQ55_8G126200 [Panicum hallii var. hallii]|uniref:Uncharacterized protein n=1 Tax=Panicum hallii var. hallii TaxID=1504633 RepID=A0A2T7CMY1_9POAL|nr:hypothetical protein GQ55_8G126200 [Panicum hallii var. hallii]